MRKSLVASCVLVTATALLAVPPGGPKLVSVHSNLPPLADLKENIARYEEQAPFDGITVTMGVCDVFRDEAFTDGEIARFKDQAKLYAQIRFTQWKYNFLFVLVDQHTPKWFDDTYWDGVVKNWGTAAKFAKQLSMVGICFDPEGYGVYPVQSHWKSDWWLKKDDKHTAKEYLDVARKRGRQVGEAVGKEFPEIVLWSYYGWSFGADLMGEFCNGILEVMPSKMKLIDGDEWTGYCAKNEGAYAWMKERNRTGCGMLDKKLVTKHNAQGGFAPSFYLDAYAFPDKCDCLHPHIKNVQSKVKYFADNLKAARRMADGGHIWIYGERNTWWTPSEKQLNELQKAGKQPRPTWEDAVPGIREALFGDRLKAKRP